MEQATVQPEKPKSRGPLVVTIVVLVVVLAGAAIAIAFLLGRESSEPVAVEEPSSTTTTTTTLGPDQLAALSEEELVALVNQVMAEVETTANALLQAEGTTDTTETVEVVVSAESLDDLVAYAEGLIDYYTTTYGADALAEQWQAFLVSIADRIKSIDLPDVSVPDVSIPDISTPDRPNR
ncbi:MAG: hypothetical protein IT198_05640 [Acidimicrobiia bacterium]|nr:hypothetical protein [Acidimicrobiia bacterium]